MSLWSSLYPVISSDPRFDAMLTQDGVLFTSLEPYF